MQFDVNRMKQADQVIAVCGAILFVCLFLPFFHVDLGEGFGTISRAGHAVGFLSWAGLWLGFLAGGLGFFPALGMPWPPQVPVTKTIATLGVSALATLLLVLKLLIGFHGASRSFGLFFAVIAVIVQVVFAVLAFRESGESLPTKADFTGGTTPTYGAQPGYTPPPAQGFAPPPAQGFAPPPAFGAPPAAAPAYQPPAPPVAPPAAPPASWQNPLPPTEPPA